jgi:hypothetical protein
VPDGCLTCFQGRKQKQHQAGEQEDVSDTVCVVQTRHASEPEYEQDERSFQKHAASFAVPATELD